MLIDAFLFHDEIDVLDIRLNALDKIVDRFVIVEGTTTFSGKPKPSVFIQNYAKFAHFGYKIRHVTAYNMPDGPDRWAREIYQRNCVLSGFLDVPDYARVLVSDVDEIPAPEVLGVALGWDRPMQIGLQNFYYYLNVTTDEFYRGSYVAPAGLIRARGAHELRLLAGRQDPMFDRMDGGWHFSCMGGPDALVHKLESFSHAEFDNAMVKANVPGAIDRLEDFLGRGQCMRVVPIDDLPPYVQRFADSKFRHMLKGEVVNAG